MKKILLISLLASFSSLSLAISEGPVVRTNTKGGALIIESAKSSSDADYFMSLDSDGIITLTPSKPVTDADWYFSDEIIVADDAKDYCSNLPGAWRTPTTLETSTEIAKLESMNENVKRFMDSGELAQQVTAVAYFNSDGLKIGIINKDHTIQQWIHSDPFAASNFIHGLCIQQ